MKIKKLKRTRKALQRLQAVHGIRPPYTVLADGTFIQASIIQRIAIKDELEKVLGAKVIVAVTDAVVAELRLLGEPFAAAAIVAKRLQRIALPAAPTSRAVADAIVHAASGGNPMKLFFATQDEKLQARLHRLVGVPLLRMARGAVVLERAAESVPGEANAQPNRALSPADRATLAKLKRKRGPAAPNPLSCRPRKRAAGQSSARATSAAAPAPHAEAPSQLGAAADSRSASEQRPRPKKRPRVRTKAKRTLRAAPVGTEG
ncbi:hypothetical protein KFE25_002765 [Diacronema lutheri]|uniref:UTP23 sensor motif region domain-containing protein n=1 Tax=Diacronema lutheri TaxID=2081491 RepID=A0A8J6CFB3_DIALT|nr:hypothetical protein KFE25_002765 [Diacronema lutheri]